MQVVYRDLHKLYGQVFVVGDNDTLHLSRNLDWALCYADVYRATHPTITGGPEAFVGHPNNCHGCWDKLDRYFIG